jgi:hypothetical protein
MFYKVNVKIIPNNIQELLTSRGLAFWIYSSSFIFHILVYWSYFRVIFISSTISALSVKLIKKGNKAKPRKIYDHFWIQNLV